ncbi:MAG: hypothetical protein ACK502_04715 [Alphaproteobacteria bacterium]
MNAAVLAALLGTATENSYAQTYDYQGMYDVENLLDYCLNRYDPAKDGWWGSRTNKPKWMGERPCEEFLPKGQPTDFLTVDQFNDVWISHGGSKTLVGEAKDHRIFNFHSLDVNKQQIEFLDLLKKNFFGKRSLAKIEESFQKRYLWMLPMTYGYLSQCQENNSKSAKFIREYFSKNNFLQLGSIGYTEAQISMFAAGKSAYGTKEHLQKESAEICSLLEEMTQKYADQYISDLKKEITKTSRIKHQCGDLRSIENLSAGRMHSKLGNRLSLSIDVVDPVTGIKLPPKQSAEDIECEKYYYDLMSKVRGNVEKAKSSYQNEINSELKNAEENQFISDGKNDSQTKLQATSFAPGFTENQRLILRQVMSVGGTITKDMHEAFWKDAPKDAQGRWDTIYLWLLENTKLAQTYQRELWNSALQSYMQQKVVYSPQLEDISKRLDQHSRENNPFGKNSSDYLAFVQQYEQGAKVSKENGRRLLEAAANRTHLQAVQGESVEITDVNIRVILDGMDAGFERVKKLMKPVWQE